MNQKGFAPILIVIIIAILVGGYLLYKNQSKPTPSPTTPQLTSTPTSTPESTRSAETTNWKTYTNTKYGYSFKYPSKQSVELGVSGAPGDDSKLETVYQVRLNSGTQPEEIAVWVWVKKDYNKNIEDFSANLEKSRPNSESITVYSKEKTLLANKEALRYIRTQPGVGKVLEVTTIKDGYTYTFSLENPDTKPQNVLLFDQILSTFKFTN